MTNETIVRSALILTGVACVIVGGINAFVHDGSTAWALGGFFVGALYILSGVSIDEPRPRY
jgi:hypothetical protein